MGLLKVLELRTNSTDHLPTLLTVNRLIITDHQTITSNKALLSGDHRKVLLTTRGHQSMTPKAILNMRRLIMLHTRIPSMVPL